MLGDFSTDDSLYGLMDSSIIGGESGGKLGDFLDDMTETTLGVAGDAFETELNDMFNTADQTPINSGDDSVPPQQSEKDLKGKDNSFFEIDGDNIIIAGEYKANKWAVGIAGSALVLAAVAWAT